MPNIRTLQELCSDLEAELIRLGYTDGSLNFYRRRWKQLMSYAEEKGYNTFSEELGTDFLETVLHIPIGSDDLTQLQVQDIRVIRMLGDFQLHHCILRRYHKHKDVLHNEYYIELVSKFRTYCVSKEYSNSTISIYVKLTSIFLDFLDANGIAACEQLDTTVIDAYLKTLVSYTYKTIEQRICAIRAFFRFLNVTGIYTNDLVDRTPMIQARKQTRIPSVWTESELKMLINAIDLGSPKGKRDYAIILLACCLGMRVSDIKRLKFSNFNWYEKRLVFTQSKTKELLNLPIPEVVGWAIIDYIKNGRPKVDTDTVFVRHLAPYLPFAENDHLTQIIYAYMRKAHIPTLQKHRGMHSLRHTAASRMLEHNIPLETISNILGHMDPESTSIYLKVDIDKLRECTMDIPEVE